MSSPIICEQQHQSAIGGNGGKLPSQAIPSPTEKTRFIVGTSKSESFPMGYGLAGLGFRCAFGWSRAILIMKQGSYPAMKNGFVKSTDGE